MKLKVIFYLLILFFAAFEAKSLASDAAPVLYKGRFRPIDTYTKLWLSETVETKNLRSEFYLWKQVILHEQDVYEKTALTLIERKLPPKDAALLLEREFPLQTRLTEQGEDLKTLPGRHDGSWYSVRTLGLKTYNPISGKLEKIQNFTVYREETFTKLQKQYLKLEDAIRGDDLESFDPLLDSFKSMLFEAYLPYAGKTYREAFGKALTYPTVATLKMENLYFSFPFIECCLALYGMAALFLIWGTYRMRSSLKTIGISFLLTALLLHTAILGMRSFILGRPPVSNMFETVVYVPCIAVWISLAFSYKLRNVQVLIASSILALILLILLKITRLNSDLENVQAVLDSQFWLTIHVLMVVGSYGMFLLSGILAHIFLMRHMLKGREAEEMRSLAGMMLQTMYLGTLLLIPGTILGGVWAAESWGRFWDWDPKESWAFISSCIYLMWIHAFRFHHIGNFGLAIGSIIGLQAITFTWYGVNYILGTGLHTYGFGDGGEIYYYLFVAMELSFILAAWLKKNAQSSIQG